MPPKNSAKVGKAGKRQYIYIWLNIVDIICVMIIIIMTHHNYAVLRPFYMLACIERF